MNKILYSTLLLLVACTAHSLADEPRPPLIVNETLVHAFRDIPATMNAERKPIEFQGGEVAKNCTRYMTLKEQQRLAEGVNNQIIKSEYLICEALDILESVQGTEASAPESLEALYSQLDLTSFPSALRPQLYGDIKTFAQLSGAILESAPQRLTVDVNDLHSTFTLAAIADVTGDGEPDWIVWLAQSLTEGNYRQYQTLVLPTPGSDDLLIEAR